MSDLAGAPATLAEGGPCVPTMEPVRRAALATFLCAAPLFAGPARPDRRRCSSEALREALAYRATRRRERRSRCPRRSRARSRGTAARSRDRPLGQRRSASLSASPGTGISRPSPAELRRSAPRRALRDDRRAGATSPSGAALVAALRATRGWPTSSATATLRAAADPFDTIDPAPASSTPGPTTPCAPATRCSRPGRRLEPHRGRDRHRPRRDPPRVRRPDAGAPTTRPAARA